MTSPRLCLPLKDWPATDRARWLAAQEPAGFLDVTKPASKWSAGSKVITEQAYGRWLAFLDRNQALDPSSTPGDRVTVDRLRDFVAELQARVAPVSVSVAAGALLRMLRVLEPQQDWTVLARVYRQLKRTAVPSRDKLSKMVPATDLLALGIRLMETWADVRSQQVYKAAQFRDGLIISILICCPMRLRNLTEIVIGRHLLFDGQAYRLEFTAAETKAGRLYHAAVPVELTPYVHEYLQVPWPSLQSIARADGPGTGGRLWLGRRGRPLSSGAIQRLIVARTTEAFGKPIYPHLFRDIAVTELVDFAPDEIGIAPDLLGHADLRTTRKHYIQAQGMTAHVRVQEVIAARRRAATSGDSTGTSRA
jgi:integrase/recombinase XerD